MSGVPDLGPVPTRIPSDVGLVRRLVATQFPQWADLPIRRVANEGWDNRTFHLGGELSVRLPSASPYALAVDKEHRWLPLLAPQLPLPIPVPVAKGAPGEGYSHAWSVYRWLGGEPASRATIADLTAFGATLADFLAALQQIDPTDGPAPGLHNWYRGGTLETYDKEAQRALEALDGHVRTDVAAEIWQAALRESWDQRPVWFHGDVAQGNLLVKDGTLVAVIDFGTCGVGDPACDLAIAWTLLSGPSRKVFRDRLSVDQATWARGRGWALWKTLATYAGALGDGGSELADAKYVLEQICTEYEESG
ncbi:aminoglycoside phosphotransferase family protein [Actinopolymorpha pittospori]|uniref:Aminoglycoside phosphotransferase (APT) family kinase protein n=1 Tax=Actinopolymorpha pittospori TaxID=648752 RepID=A0A927MTR7_9ACTN|nr:aminoglycoside phosphotransferase family protein [Actinopolymorpha pittospori]MBE1606489.1 aminoglycoside phosphotransferase (APT) family kinase protein [Actinopolymorpha pittospori]